MSTATRHQQPAALDVELLRDLVGALAAVAQ